MNRAQKEHDNPALEQGGWELEGDTLLGRKTAFTWIGWDGKEAGEKVIFWELKRMAATASLTTLGAWVFQS